MSVCACLRVCVVGDWGNENEEERGTWLAWGMTRRPMYQGVFLTRMEQRSAFSIQLSAFST